MALQPRPFLTPEAYLAIERQAEYKSEYCHGEMLAMAGASRKHNLIVTNIVRELSQQLKQRPCEVYPSDMRVRIPTTSLYTYPDVIVVCDEPQFEDDTNDTLLNPTLIVEVLSNTTEAYDRGKKFAQYRTLPSLVEYVLVTQDEPRVEHYVRQPDNRWLFSETPGLDGVVQCMSIHSELALQEIYDKVKLL